jgi:hypothetical protein
MQIRMEPTNNGTLVKSREGFWTGHLNGGDGFTGNAGRTLGLFVWGGFAAPLRQLCHRPCLPPTKGEASLVGGNHRVQKCDSIDPLSLKIKCLGGGGYKSGDVIVLIIDKQPPPSGGQVNTHKQTLVQ